MRQEKAKVYITIEVDVKSGPHSSPPEWAWGVIDNYVKREFVGMTRIGQTASAKIVCAHELKDGQFVRVYKGETDESH